jgi:hypothetical protein
MFRCLFRRRFHCMLIVPLFLLPGCAAAPLAMIGTAFGIAGSAVSTGSDVYKSGKLDSSELGSFDDVRAAVFLAADELRLTTLYETPGTPTRVIRFADDQAATIDVTLDPRTPMLTGLRIDVGLRGSEPTARLILRRARAHLPSAPPVVPEVPG